MLTYVNMNMTRLWCKIVLNISVGQIKGNGELHFSLYLLGTWLKQLFEKKFNLRLAHVHPCAPMCTHV